MNNNFIKFREVINQGRYHKFINQFDVNTEDIVKWLKEPSVDFKDGRPLLKHKSVNKNYINN